MECVGSIRCYIVYYVDYYPKYRHADSECLRTHVLMYVCMYIYVCMYAVPKYIYACMFALRICLGFDSHQVQAFSLRLFFSPGATTPIGGCILQPSSGL